MSTKKTDNRTGNAFVRFGRGFVNFFKRIGTGFSNVRQELKRVIWPTREKLIQTSVVVLVVIAVAAILLTGIQYGAKYVLDKVGFYGTDKGEVSETTVLPSDESTSETSASETSVSEESADLSE